MLEVIIAPLPDGGRAARDISALLSDYRPTATLSDGVYRRPAGRDGYLIIGTPLRRVEAKGCILIVGEGAAAIPRVEGGSPVLLCGVHAGASGLTGQIISCGLGVRDTITVSSLTRESAVVSLQRPVTTLSGRRVEPCELPLSLPSGMDVHHVLAAAGVLLLSDAIGAES